MMGKVREMQEKIKKAQEDLVNLQTTAESGGGMVKATVNGKKQLLSLEIDDSLVNSDDKEMLSDLVVAAVNMAMENADAMAKEELKKSTEGILPNIPGFDLGSMMG